MNSWKFQKEYQKVPVEHYPANVPEEPLVSVCVQTYQHSDYIEDCLEGILMQQTSFEYEILLGEDASRDGTREICIEYAKKYPEKIRLFLHHRKNNIQIGGQPTGRFNFLYNLFRVNGKYIAFCEGDDYWTDSYKLQKQVLFMEENPEFAGVYTNFSICNIKGEITEKETLKKDQPRYFDWLSVLGKHSSRTLTVMYKNIPDVIGNIVQFIGHVNIDRVLAVLMAQQGKIKYLDFVSGVYRQGSGYHSTMQAKEKRKNRIRLYQAFKQYFDHQEIVEVINKRLNKLYIYEMCRALVRVNINRVRNINNVRKKETGMPFSLKQFISDFFHYIKKATLSRFKMYSQKAAVN